MLEELKLKDHSSTVLRSIYVWFLRIMAVFSMVAGLTYWSQLVGIANEGTLRFDLVAQNWRVLSSLLAVILPAAALGLWLNQAWGVLLWVVAALMEIAAYGIWSDVYVAKPAVVIVHAVSLTFLAVVLFVLFLQRRKHHTSLF
ncbi:MAG: DUF6163 family protein [Ahrensia sp.]|nr:DUF6163 family protein [Ahrensia sp.]